MNQQGVRHAAPKDVARELIVELRAVPDVLEVGLSVARHVETRLRLHAREQALVVIPIRRVDGHRAVPVAVHAEKRAQPIANRARLPFVERREPKPFRKASATAEHLLIAQNVRFEVFRRDAPE